MTTYGLDAKHEYWVVTYDKRRPIRVFTCPAMRIEEAERVYKGCTVTPSTKEEWMRGVEENK